MRRHNIGLQRSRRRAGGKRLACLADWHGAGAKLRVRKAGLLGEVADRNRARHRHWIGRAYVAVIHPIGAERHPNAMQVRVTQPGIDYLEAKSR